MFLFKGILNLLGLFMCLPFIPRKLARIHDLTNPSWELKLKEKNIRGELSRVFVMRVRGRLSCLLEPFPMAYFIYFAFIRFLILLYIFIYEGNGTVL